MISKKLNQLLCRSNARLKHGKVNIIFSIPYAVPTYLLHSSSTRSQIRVVFPILAYLNTFPHFCQKSNLKSDFFYRITQLLALKNTSLQLSPVRNKLARLGAGRSHDLSYLLENRKVVFTPEFSYQYMPASLGSKSNSSPR